MPDFFETAFLEVAHGIFAGIAGEHLPVGIDKELIAARSAGEQPGLPLDEGNEPQVQVGPEPILDPQGKIAPPGI